jgi:uroporphyrinogen-III synthase
MRLLVTRPQPDASRQAEILQERGYEAVLAPLLELELIDGPIPLGDAQALVASSRNAIRALAAHPQREEALKLPLFAVGEATAGAARELGFADLIIGPGTAAELAALIASENEPGRGRFVHLAGEVLAFDLKAALEAEGFVMDKAVLYRAIPAEAFPAEALTELTEGRLDGAILMSRRAAATYAALIVKHGLTAQAQRLVCYCLSETVAQEAAPLGCEIRVAARPREEDILALLDAEAAS